MKCPLKILISVQYDGQMVDVEVATNYTIGEIKNSIINTFKAMKITDNLDSMGANGIHLYHGDMLLEEDKILANYGVWDGSILIVR